MSFPKIILPILLLLLVGAGYYYYNGQSQKDTTADLKTTIKKGEFKIHVTATGELQAKRSEKIRGPQGMRAAGIWNTTISDLVTEGTVVKKGDYVATLDRTELENKIKDAGSELEKIETQLEQAKIDTAIDLRGARDELINLRFARQEKVLQVEQSKYEPQMVIQQAQIDLERTDRDYSQLTNKYSLKQEQAEAKISEINALLKQNQNKLDLYMKLMEDFIVKAPKDGMVIYARSWNGKKGPGSQVSSWNPTVAELPDLSDMVSKTYVNEVDISKVKKGQDVEIKVDAFPNRAYTGSVIKVANIGEQLKNYDAKVFEVTVQVNAVDSILRPAMTTANEILTNIYDDVLFVPIEALHNDSFSYVIKTDVGKVVKQEVITGSSNDNEILIEHGIKEGDEIYLTKPSDADDFPIVLIDQKIKDDIKRKQEEEAQARQAKMMEKLKNMKDEDLPTTKGGDDVIIIMN